MNNFISILIQREKWIHLLLSINRSKNIYVIIKFRKQKKYICIIKIRSCNLKFVYTCRHKCIRDRVYLIIPTSLRVLFYMWLLCFKFKYYTPNQLKRISLEKVHPSPVIGLRFKRTRKRLMKKITIILYNILACRSCNEYSNLTNCYFYKDNLNMFIKTYSYLFFNGLSYNETTTCLLFVITLQHVCINQYACTRQVRRPVDNQFPFVKKKKKKST